MDRTEDGQSLALVQAEGVVTKISPANDGGCVLDIETVDHGAISLTMRAFAAFDGMIARRSLSTRSKHLFYFAPRGVRTGDLVMVCA